MEKRRPEFLNNGVEALLFGPSFCEKSDYLIKNNEFRFDIPVVSKSICSMEIPLQ